MAAEPKHLRPTGGHVLVRLDDLSDKSETGRIWLPQDRLDMDSVKSATVVSTGPGPYPAEGGHTRMAMPVQCGDRILIRWCDGAKLDDYDPASCTGHKMLRWDELLAVVDG